MQDACVNELLFPGDKSAEHLEKSRLLSEGRIIQGTADRAPLGPVRPSPLS